jgi:hypothetical protein
MYNLHVYLVYSLSRPRGSRLIQSLLASLTTASLARLTASAAAETSRLLLPFLPFACA